MDRPILVKCDALGGCSKEFKIKELKVAKLDAGIEKTYFSCPSCNKEYLAFYTDRNIRKKQAKMRTLTDLAQMNKLKQEIGKDMARLKAKLDA